MTTNTALQPLTGYHHMTMVTADALANLRFYAETLGLRFLKKTVNFDDPTAYHLYYGDHEGHPGTILTFFEWPRAVKGNPGIGGTHHIALAVGGGAALAYWRGRLERAGVDVSEPFDDHGFPTIRFHDPDGLILELSAPAGEDVPDGAPVLDSPAFAIGRIHHVAIHASNEPVTAAFYRDLLGLDAVGEGANFDDPGRRDVLYGFPDGDPGMLLVVTYADPSTLPRARYGAGQTHHIAYGVADDAVELAWQERIAAAGVNISEVRDRDYFHSIYFNNPDGHLQEIATANPGFAVDEPLEQLGSALKLPAWLESRRAELERALTPLPSPAARG